MVVPLVAVAVAVIPLVVPFWAEAVMEGEVEAELAPESKAGDSMVRRSKAEDVNRESASA